MDFDMSIGKNNEELQKQIGYTFRNPSLLHQALTHSSFTNEAKIRHCEEPSNERMEFLGDAVLQILVSECLYTRYPDVSEGMLTKFRQHLVCEGMLATLSRKIKLGSYLSLGNGEELQGRDRPSILADAFEALLAAVYLDAEEEGLNCAREFLMRLMKKEIDACGKNHGGDYKTQLQHIVQQDGAETLEYEVTDVIGPAHSPRFVVIAKINSNIVGRGEGSTKREAEQLAAKDALLLFGIGEDDA